VLPTQCALAGTADYVPSTPPITYPHDLLYNCTDPPKSAFTLYSNCETLAISCNLYYDELGLNIVPNGSYSSGSSIYYTDNGAIYDVDTCTVVPPPATLNQVVLYPDCNSTTPTTYYTDCTTLGLNCYIYTDSQGTIGVPNGTY